MLYNIYNGIRQKDLGKALFSQNGVAGFIFYWAVVAAALCTLLTNVKLLNPLYIGLLIVLPLLLIFAQQPLGRLLARREDWMPRERAAFWWKISLSCLRSCFPLCPTPFPLCALAPLP